MPSSPYHVAIVGASGYTGGELFRLLLGHPDVHIAVVASSERTAGQRLTDLFPHFATLTSLSLEPFCAETIGHQADVVFLALPHTQSMEPVHALAQQEKLVIDLSADYRLHAADVYAQWYGTPHRCPDLLTQAVYGLPEVHRASITKSRLIAVPGCYPTAAILQLAPLLRHGLIDPRRIVIDAKSGVSGAGRTPAPAYHFPEAHEAMHAYKIGRHRHVPEIEQELSLLHAGSHHADASAAPGATVSFTPHLAPMNRGILSTAYSFPTKSGTKQDYDALFAEAYDGEPFVRMCTDPAHVNPRHVRGTNFCDLSVTYDPRTRAIVTVAAIDNLVKGAAGQAIQAMNIALGLPETRGLTAPAAFP